MTTCTLFNLRSLYFNPEKLKIQKTTPAPIGYLSYFYLTL
ncbi:MAG: hypothetical protein OJF59_001508 [Cytophagales bacterium]|jgi:hypothetical protein|nr:MAG: hypothetical protein OJF59_001508 [Cytophagales bacterium]